MFAKLALSAVAIAVGTVATANAAPQAVAASATVSLAGLDLDSDAGARVALSRIRTAAQQVCGDEWSARTIGGGVAWSACYRNAIDRAVVAVNRPALTAVSNGELAKPDTLTLGGR